MKRLSSLGVWSIFRISLALGAVAGLLIGVILMIQAFVDRHFFEGITYLVLAPLLYGLLGALVNAFMAWIYNRVAERFGGIEISLED